MKSGCGLPAYPSFSTLTFPSHYTAKARAGARDFAMRFLHVDRLKLKEFFGRDIPRYAILSYMWDEEEFAFSNLQGDLRGFSNILYEDCTRF